MHKRIHELQCRGNIEDFFIQYIFLETIEWGSWTYSMQLLLQREKSYHQNMTLCYEIKWKFNFGELKPTLIT